MALFDDIKAVAKDGADLSAIEKGLEGMNPLGGVTDKDTAWDFIKTNPLMLSAFDKEQGKRAKTVEENLMSGKVQELIKAREEEIRKELNPEETPEQKRIRELEDKLSAGEAKELTLALKDALSEKAKELEFDPLKARDYAIYGEKATEKLEADSAWMKAEIKAQVDAQVKEKFSGNRQPKKPNIEPATLDEKIREARARGDSAGALRLQLIKDQQQ